MQGKLGKSESKRVLLESNILFFYVVNAFPKRKHRTASPSPRPKCVYKYTYIIFSEGSSERYCFLINDHVYLTPLPILCRVGPRVTEMKRDQQPSAKVVATEWASMWSEESPWVQADRSWRKLTLSAECEVLTMVRTYKRTSSRAKVPIDVIKIAVKKVLVDNMLRRSVAQDYNIPFKTLSRYCTKRELLDNDQEHHINQVTGVGYSKHKQVFSICEEELLAP
ncbi:hypothetical protein QTP88_018016 [Uroleucon formosanum]